MFSDPLHEKSQEDQSHFSMVSCWKLKSAYGKLVSWWKLKSAYGKLVEIQWGWGKYYILF